MYFNKSTNKLLFNKEMENNYDNSTKLLFS